MQNKIHIGTSGWSYKHWKAIFYPPKVGVAKWLPYYAAQFSTTEINGSFYRLPSEETVANWIRQVPADFIFCPKMSRYLTHMKKLREPEEPLQRFFSVFDEMKNKMGPVLIQLPPMLKFNYEVAENFYRLLYHQYNEYSFAVEVRHDSWLHEKSRKLLADYNIAFVISQSANFFPYAEAVTAKNIYLRFHGPAGLYASSYSDAALQAYAKKIKQWVEEGHEIWAYFNNDIGGHAVTDALRLRASLKEK